jgi:hypothetical protein
MPSPCQTECHETALKFVHGPRFWLYRIAGHVDFRAEGEIGFPAIPKCIESAGYHILYCAQIKQFPDLLPRVQPLKSLRGPWPHYITCREGDCRVPIHLLPDNIYKVWQNEVFSHTHTHTHLWTFRNMYHLTIQVIMLLMLIFTRLAQQWISWNRW